MGRRYLAAVGASASRNDAALLGRFAIPESNASHGTFLSRVRTLLERAAPVRDQLVAQGMTATLLDDITAALGRFEESLSLSRAGHKEQTGATSALDQIEEELREVIRVLDGVVFYRFRDNAELMGAWDRVRNVADFPRPRRATVPTPDTVETEVKALPPGEIAPAA